MSDPADGKALREAFGAFMTGVTIVTTVDETGAPVGFTANSFTSVSLNPPLLLVCIAKTSRNLAAFLAADGYAVNILSERQEHLSRRFAAPVDDRFKDVAWSLGPAGGPVLDGVCGWFDCADHKKVEAGDHVILIGEVKGYALHPARPLGYAKGDYFSLAR